MVDQDHSIMHSDEVNPHSDGKIELGNHSERLTELTGQPTPDSFPVSLFELQDGRTTLEQVRVVHFFVQEYRNKDAAVRTKPYLMEVMLSKFAAEQSDDNRKRLMIKAEENRHMIDNMDYLTGEAEELIRMLRSTTAQAKRDESAYLSPEERKLVLDEALAESESLEAEKAGYEATPWKDRTPAQHERMKFVSPRLAELHWTIKAYSVPPEEIARQLHISKSADLQSLQTAQEQGDNSQSEQIVRLEADVNRLNEMLADYDAFVQSEMSKPILSAESQQMIVLLRDLQIAVAEYKGPLMAGSVINVPDREAMVQLLTHPILQEIMPAVTQGL